MSELHLKQISEEQIEALLRLQEIVFMNLKQKDQLSTLTKEEFKRILTGEGYMVGVFCKEQLIAARALLKPRSEESEHLGLDAGLTKDQLNQVVYQEISLVHPEFRGNRLQQRMGNWLMQNLVNEGSSYSFICATVAPTNLASLIDKFKQGLEVVALKEKYGGKLRFVFFKDLNDPSNFTVLEEKEVELTALEEQRHLLQEGYRGNELKNEDGRRYRIRYQLRSKNESGFNML
ncbi:GNAT family N-acetyltransferase [Bacillus sp. C1-1]|nr:GNAT family N-acetyltransferase [Bacillus sp. C1-1]